MQSWYIVKICIVTLLMSAVMFFLVSCSQGAGTNWKKYFTDKDGNNFFYDKNSIHFPKTKKSVFGLTVKDKEIVNVWVKNEGSNPELAQIYCVERKCEHCGATVGFSFDDLPDPLGGNGLKGKLKNIEPGSRGESLLEKVCP